PGSTRGPTSSATRPRATPGSKRTRGQSFSRCHLSSGSDFDEQLTRGVPGERLAAPVRSPLLEPLRFGQQALRLRLRGLEVERVDQILALDELEERGIKAIGIAWRCIRARPDQTAFKDRAQEIERCGVDP